MSLLLKPGWKLQKQQRWDIIGSTLLSNVKNIHISLQDTNSLRWQLSKICTWLSPVSNFKIHFVTKDHLYSFRNPNSKETIVTALCISFHFWSKYYYNTCTQCSILNGRKQYAMSLYCIHSSYIVPFSETSE